MSRKAMNEPTGNESENSVGILVLGAGPAGGAVALGLKKLGFNVAVVTSPRPFKAVEGISQRVLEGLKNAGFQHAITNLPAPSPRNASWNGESNQANTEILINRETLDQGILKDLEEAGVEIFNARAGNITETACGFRVALKDSSKPDIATDFLVEARGRSAPAAGGNRVRGQETVSVLQQWTGKPCPPQSAAESFEQGWAWMAAWSDGTRYLQLTLDVATAGLPKKSDMVEHCNAILRRLPAADPFIQNAEPSGAFHARTSTPILNCEAIGDRWIRVGDAAMAVDPLSGNGIFQALSSALQAPAVINTLLKAPERAALAKQFYQQRVDHLFYRFARIGRDFYAMEERWPENPFWSDRRNWPDLEPLHQVTDPESLKVKRMPVVNNGLIEEQDTVVTNDQPLGIWHLNGLEMAPVVRALQSRNSSETLPECLVRFGIAPEMSAGLANWLKQNRWVE